MAVDGGLFCAKGLAVLFVPPMLVKGDGAGAEAPLENGLGFAAPSWGGWPKPPAPPKGLGFATPSCGG